MDLFREEEEAAGGFLPPPSLSGCGAYWVHSPALHILQTAGEQARAPAGHTFPPTGCIAGPRAGVAEVTEMVSEKENLPLVAPSPPAEVGV